MTKVIITVDYREIELGDIDPNIEGKRGVLFTSKSMPGLMVLCRDDVFVDWTEMLLELLLSIRTLIYLDRGYKTVAFVDDKKPVGNSFEVEIRLPPDFTFI